jgi:hypothetical protein
MGITDRLLARTGKFFTGPKARIYEGTAAVAGDFSTQ